jgi:preprotein translocase subunit SecG
MNFFFYATLFTLFFVAVVLILLILIQKGRGGGLSGAFGGSGGSTAFGTKTGDVLTLATSIIFILFLGLAVALDLIVSHQYPSTPPGTVASSSVPAAAALPPVTPAMPEPTPTTPIVPTPVVPTPTIPTPAIPTPTLPTTLPATTTPTVSGALNNLGNSLQSATTAPGTLDNGLKQVQKDIAKVQQGIAPATKP